MSTRRADDTILAEDKSKLKQYKAAPWGEKKNVLGKQERRYMTTKFPEVANVGQVDAVPTSMGPQLRAHATQERRYRTTKFPEVANVGQVDAAPASMGPQSRAHVTQERRYRTTQSLRPQAWKN